MACKLDCDDGDYVTIESMYKHFWTDAWKKKIRDGNSRLCRLLKLSCFVNEDEGLSAGEISFLYLAIYGFIHTVGTKDQKLDYLYELLQEGGVDKNTHIAAKDKDFVPTFTKIFRFVTVDLFEQAAAIDQVKNKYIEFEDKINEVIDEDEDEEDSLQGFILEEIYGNKAKLSYEDWKKTILKSKTLVFLFDPVLMRKKIMEKSGVSFP